MLTPVPSQPGCRQDSVPAGTGAPSPPKAGKRRLPRPRQASLPRRSRRRAAKASRLPHPRLGRPSPARRDDCDCRAEEGRGRHRRRGRCDRRPSAGSGPSSVEEGVGSLEATTGKGGPPVPAEVLRAARAGWEAYQRGDVKKAREMLRPVAANPAVPAVGALRARLVAIRAWARRLPTAANGSRCALASRSSSRSTSTWPTATCSRASSAKAIASSRKPQKRWPKDVEVYNAMGVIQPGRGALNDAIKTFEKAVAVDPTDATACYNLAKSLELRYVQMQRLRKVSPQNAVGGPDGQGSRGRVLPADRAAGRAERRGGEGGAEEAGG